MTKRLWKVLTALLMSAAMVFTMTACGDKKAEDVKDKTEEQQEEAAEDMVELSEDQMDDLYQQAAEKVLELQYKDYLPDEIVGHAETFSIDRDGDKGTWDVLLMAEEYVALDGKAYSVSGSYGEAILEFDYTENGPKLIDVIWSEDGEVHDQWIEENFTDEAKKNMEIFNKDEKNRDLMLDILEQKAEDKLKVPVEDDLILTIDKEEGTYVVEKPVESGDPESDDYKFETETIRKGKLEDLKK